MLSSRAVGAAHCRAGTAIRLHGSFALFLQKAAVQAADPRHRTDVAGNSEGIRAASRGIRTRNSSKCRAKTCRCWLSEWSMHTQCLLFSAARTGARGSTTQSNTPEATHIRNQRHTASMGWSADRLRLMRRRERPKTRLRREAGALAAMAAIGLAASALIAIPAYAQDGPAGEAVSGAATMTTAASGHPQAIQSLSVSSTVTLPAITRDSYVVSNLPVQLAADTGIDAPTTSLQRCNQARG